MKKTGELQELLAKVTPDNIHKEIDFGKPVGKEIIIDEYFLKYKGFSGICEYDSDREIYTGEVTGVRSTITFQGCTAEEVVASFRESVDIYLKMCEGDHLIID